MTDRFMSGRMMWFWRGWIGTATTVLVGLAVLAFGGAVEARYDPPIVNVALIDGSIDRDADRLCWSFRSDKLRPVILKNVDSFLERPVHHDMSFPTVLDKHTGVAWHSGGMAPVAIGNIHDACVDLRTVGAGETAVRSNEPLVLNVTAWFKSQYGPWQVPLRIPEVVSLGTN